MCSHPEAERVFRVLRELREHRECVDVRNDVDQLEKVLNDPLFMQYNKKASTYSSKVSGEHCASSSLSLVQFLKENTEEELKSVLKENQSNKFFVDELKGIRVEDEGHLSMVFFYAVTCIAWADLNSTIAGFLKKLPLQTHALASPFAEKEE
ncbi:hypothetical protein DICVIV_09436 [Dictyocaulus viviparus]|uniref:Uncharacterized protein n=1 Tax=Dictyocaulus viviparus TaxID=29172 RepID=A0A0D8XL63_DICVI|nr:hypothetical protein DICVIV_09436 [Dictyocaulus viviparus]